MKKIIAIVIWIGISVMFVSTTFADLNDGLVAYYPFNGNANDESGNGNDGTVYGAVLTNDRFGNADSAYSFDGIDDYINIGNNVKPNFPITVSTWVNIHTLQDGNGLIRNDQWNPTAYYHGLYVTVSLDGKVGCGVGSGYASSWTRKQYGTNLSLITENTWYHIVVVFNAYNDMHIYVDGVEYDGTYGGDGTTMTYSSANGVIGQRWADKTNGEIDDIRVYNRALSESEIQELYSATMVNNPPSAFELVYPADGQTGLGTTVEFRWKESTDPDGDTVTYDLYVCEDEGFTTGCITKEDIVATSRNTGIYYAGSVSGAGLLIFGIVLGGSVKGRRKIALLIAMIMIAGMLLVSCGDGDNNGNGDNGGDTTDEVSYTVSGLNTSNTYYWKVVAKDGNGGETESETRSFTTQ